MDKPLSPAMQAALDAATANGGKLELWHHAMWTYAGCPARRVSGLVTPDQCFTWGTIKALLDRGLMQKVNAGGYAVEVEVVS